VLFSTNLGYQFFCLVFSLRYKTSLFPASVIQTAKPTNCFQHNITYSSLSISSVMCYFAPAIVSSIVFHSIRNHQMYPKSNVRRCGHSVIWSFIWRLLICSCSSRRKPPQMIPPQARRSYGPSPCFSPKFGTPHHRRSPPPHAPQLSNRLKISLAHSHPSAISSLKILFLF